MSILTRVYTPRHPLVAAGASLEDMYVYQQFRWVKYPADIDHIVICFRRQKWRGREYYRMLDTFVSASVQCGLPVNAVAEGLDDRVTRRTLRRVRTWYVALQRLRSRTVAKCECVAQVARHPCQHFRHVY